MGYGVVDTDNRRRRGARPFEPSAHVNRNPAPDAEAVDQMRARLVAQKAPDAGRNYGTMPADCSGASGTKARGQVAHNTKIGLHNGAFRRHAEDLRLKSGVPGGARGGANQGLVATGPFDRVAATNKYNGLSHKEPARESRSWRLKNSKGRSQARRTGL